MPVAASPKNWQASRRGRGQTANGRITGTDNSGVRNERCSTRSTGLHRISSPVVPISLSHNFPTKCSRLGHAAPTYASDTSKRCEQ